MPGRFMVSHKEELTISHHNTKFKPDMLCTNIVVLNTF